jgi:hypothetical protein
MMRLGASVLHDLRRILAEEVAAGERAAMAAIRAETEQAKQELRQQVMAAFGGRARGLANAWRSRVFPATGRSLRPAGLAFTKVPAIIDAFDRGVTIRPRGGRKFLAIPTGFNAARGHRGRGGRGLRVTPAQMVASRQAFLRPFKNGRGFVWCLPVRQAPAEGRRRPALIAGGLAAVATARRKGARGWQAALLRQGFVPMFLLLPQVSLAKRLDIAAVQRAALRRLPGRFVAAWERESGRMAA